MDTNSLYFKDEIIVNVPKKILYNFQLKSYQITKREYKSPDKINIEKNGDSLFWKFDSGIGTNISKFHFVKLGKNKTKVNINITIPKSNSILFGNKQKYEGESGILGNEIFYKTLEYIYNENIKKEKRNINSIQINSTPFYCTEYSDDLYLRSDDDAIYIFIKKKYQLFNEIKNRFTTMKDKKKPIKIDERNRYLMVKNKKPFCSIETHYLFHSSLDSKKLKLKFRVPYLYLLSRWNRAEIRNIYKGKITVIRAFDEIYKKYFK